MQPARLTLAQCLCRPLPPLLAQSLRNWIYPYERALHDDHPFIARSQTGSLLKSRTSDYHAYRVAVHGYHDWRLWAVAVALCGPGDTIIEIGANVGTETIGFGDIVGASGKVFAFEPLPSNRSVLLETVSLNQRPVQVLPFAVGDTVGPVRFELPRGLGASGGGHVEWFESAGSDAGIEVECVTLDSMADRLGPANLISMDAEGSEPRVLRGAESYLRACRPAIILEAGPKQLGRAGSSPQQLRAELERLDYRVFVIRRFGLDPIERGADSKIKNWLALPQSRPKALQAVRRQILYCGLLPCIAGINPLSRPAAA
jgi:FkbM family methyltransferase